MGETEDLRAIPSVDLVMRRLEEAGLLEGRPRALVVRAVRRLLERERVALARGAAGAGGGGVREGVLEAVERAIARGAVRRLEPVVNATGIIVHTNLGRAPLAEDVLRSVSEVASGYSSLEYDPALGERGRREDVVLDALLELTGAEDALVTNNNAAAVMLALDTLARGREVVVSRSELIEIGGSFRLPEVFERSGARMVPVGTTNRTHDADYEAAITSRTGALLTAHWSNYEIVGFVERVPLTRLVSLGSRWGIPVIHDLGSGVLADRDTLGLAGEMTPAESVAAGVGVVCVSGDKMLGGPQAGIAAGRGEIVARMRLNPLMRAVRPGKLTLAALAATLRHYLEGDAVEAIPVLRMIREPVETLRKRADAVRRKIAEAGPARVEAAVVEVESQIGGGAAPGRGIPSVGIALTPEDGDAEGLMRRLLEGAPPVVTRVRGDRVLLDMRTVLPREDAVLAGSVVRAAGREA
jgi:L-seryl-tRNA(Ser) seleniumtransferase